MALLLGCQSMQDYGSFKVIFFYIKTKLFVYLKYKLKIAGSPLTIFRLIS